jgi:S1-C subfamily serine protease
MKKRLVIPLCFILISVLGFESGYGQDNDDHGILHFAVVSKDGKPDNNTYRLYVNDQFVSVFNLNENNSCDFFSEGTVNIEIMVGPSINLFVYHSIATFTMDLEQGSEYFIINDLNKNEKDPNFGFHISDSTEWNNFKTQYTKQVKHKEDKLTPWLKNEGGRSGKGQGTCFLISPKGYLITNYHCVEKAKEITVKGIDGDFTTKYGATVVASDESNDLALIKIGNKNVKFESPVFGIRGSGVSQAEKVYAMGFPIASAMGNEVKVTEGIISSKSGVHGDVSRFQISAAINHGNSGGPLIDEQGNLIGVIYAKSTLAESAGYAVKAGYLEAFLRNVDGFELPSFINTIKDKSLTEKVTALKDFVFIVEAK